MENRDELKELLESIDRKIEEYKNRREYLLNVLEEFFNEEWDNDDDIDNEDYE